MSTLRASILVAIAACGQSTQGGNPGMDSGHPTDGPTSDSTRTGDGSVQPSTGVSIIVEPDGSHTNPVAAAITAATTSVYMTMYEIDDSNVLDALVARKTGGLDVKVILDSSTTNKSSNTPAFNQLKNAGVGVVWSSSVFTFTHEKTVMIDGTTAWIMTMNANVSSPYDNREYLAVDTNAADVAEATAVFNADFAMQTITPSGALVVADTNARPKLFALIGSATKSVDLEVEEFSDADSNGIVDALVQAANRGVKVRVVIGNESLGSSQTSANSAVTHAGGSVVMTGPSSGNGTTSKPYIHGKAIAIDCNGTTTACTTGWVGSENMSANSLSHNRELGVIFAEPSEIAKVETAFNTDFAAGVAK